MKRTVVHVILVLMVCCILLVIPATAASVNPVSITVTINRVHQLNEPDIDGCCSDADFYAGVKIGNSGYQESGVYEEDAADISPNWQFGQPVFLEDIGDGIPIYIQLWDDDSPYSNDDPIDINPDPNYQILLINFDPFTGKWHGYTDTGYARGDNGDQAEIWFTVESNVGPDTDQDGIPDSFEMNEIRDKNGNVIADLNAMGADPCRKTIAIEVDYMGGAADGHTHEPDPNAIAEAVTMFDNAPVPASGTCPYPGYPKKPTGVDLLVKVDEQIPESDPFGCSNFDNEFKAAHFNPVLSGIFHYNLWVHDHDATSSSGVACGGGKGDFLVSLGSWCPTVDPPYCPVATQNGNQRDQAGTLAHELGHTLGLGHGGVDGINFKPNYLSIMSYEWQTVGLTDSATGITRLDFSHSALPTLNEQSLSEPNGIGDGTFITDWHDSTGTKHGDIGNKALDWTWDDRNGNGIADDDTGVNVDINGDNLCIGGGLNNVVDSALSGDDTLDPNCECDPATPCPCVRNGPNGQCESTASGDDLPGYIFPGYDDWSHINYGYDTVAGSGMGLNSHNEITFEQARIIKAFWVQVLAPDLSVDKEVDLADALPGDTLTYTVTVTNEGKVPVTAISLTDTFPYGAQETRVLPDLALGTSGTETFTYVVPFPIPDGEVITNTAEVTGTDINGNPEEDTTNNIATASTTVHTPVLTLAKTATASVNAGEAITYTLTYQNTGSADAEGVIITDTLPKDVYYSLALDLGTGPKPGSVGSNPDGTTTLTWTLGGLVIDSDVQTISYTARPGLLFLAGSSVTNNAVLDFTDGNGNDYPALTATATTTITAVTPGKTPTTLGYYRNHPDVWTAETLARIQATDTRFDGADGSSPDGQLSSDEVTAIFVPGGNQPKVLLMQLLATDFNLATRQINAGTGIKSKTATRLGLTTVRSADVYAMETLKLPVTNKNMGQYSDATTVLDEINNGKSEVY